MKKRYWIIHLRFGQVFAFCILAIIFAAGCSSKGFNRGELQAQVSVVKPSFDESEIKKAFDKKPNLPKPFKIAVYYKAPSFPKNDQGKWRWTDEDKAILDGVVSGLKASGAVSEIFPIISTIVQDESLKSLRLVAAKHQADALLIITGAAQTDRYINGWGWSYILLAPALFVPGSEADALFLSSASLWDVRNEYLYLTSEAEASVHETHIAAFGKRDEELFNQAKSKALANLKVELSKMINGEKL